MVETILDKVLNIKQESKNTQDFHRLDELMVDLEKKFKETPSQELQLFVSQLKQETPIIHSNAILDLNNFSIEWETRRTGYKDKQLEDGEKLAETLLRALGKYSSEDFPTNVYGDDYISKSKASLNTLKGKIEDEKERRKEGPGDGSSLDKQIKKLKKQIERLEQKLRDTPDSDASLKNSYKEQIKELRKSLVEKEREKSQGKEGGFPTKLVLISVGAAAVVMLLLAILYSQFSRRNQRY